MTLVEPGICAWCMLPIRWYERSTIEPNGHTDCFEYHIECHRAMRALKEPYDPR